MSDFPLLKKVLRRTTSASCGFVCYWEKRFERPFVYLASAVFLWTEVPRSLRPGLFGIARATSYDVDSIRSGV